MPGSCRAASVLRICTLALACLYLPAVAAPAITIGTLNNFTSKVNGMVLQEVYRRAGIPLAILQMPPPRAAAMADAGEVDGEVNRIFSYADQHPNLIRVEPALNTWTVAAFYKKTALFKIQTAADLRERQIGIVRGIKAAADLTAGIPKVSIAPSSRELMLMLDGNRFDVAVDGMPESGYFIRILGLHGIQSTALEHYQLFHYLHQKHKNLVPLISREIKKMADSGDLQKVFDKAVNDLLASGFEP